MHEGLLPSSPEPRVAAAPDFLAGGAELGRLIRGFDWAATPLGVPATWPQNLRMALRIMLTSRQPIWVGWGSELIYFYNDPYKSIIGGKHPWALGRPTREVWHEIWADIAPLLATAMGGDQGTYVESQLLIMERNGYPEETYYTFSYSPIPNDDGTVGGIICANSDDTQRVIGERQLALLRELAASTTHSRTVADACEQCAAALATNPRDLPFAMIYMVEPDGTGVRLMGEAGIDRGHPALPELIGLDDASPWPIGEVLRTHRTVIMADPAAAIGMGLPCGPWAQAPRDVALLPILQTGEAGRAGVLIVGLNRFRLFDQNYQGFLSLVAGQIAAAIANATAYEEERRRAEAFAEIDRAKTAFFSNVSHEFRTPLTLMLGPLEDALNDRSLPVPPLQRHRLETAHRNSLRLLKLVNSLLDFSRIEAGRADAHFEETDLARFTAELASNFESATEKAGLALTIDCRPLPEPIFVDRDMWEKIVLNLVSNAFKFTFTGGITVRLRATADGRAAEMVVNDTGVGIPAQDLPRVFERFHRIEGQRGRSFEGSGIGLALVQELVRLHGGTIRAESSVGAGTAFSVVLPFGADHLAPERVGTRRESTSSMLRAEAYVEEAMRWLPGSADDGTVDRAEAASDPLPGGGHGACILVAEDNADMRDYMRRLLGARWDVVTVADGQAALDAARERKPDLVLTDVMMPRLDGFGLLRELRRSPELRDLPVILLSARAGEEARLEGLDAGADDYLIKPFSARELTARISANLEMARIRREATRDLRESEARFRNMADHAPIMMWVTEPHGAITYVNRTWCEFTGQTLGTAVGSGAWDAVHPEDRTPLERFWSQTNSDRLPFSIEVRVRRLDGAYRWVLSAAAPRFADDGEFMGYIGSVIDITDRKEAEQMLRHANESLEERVAAAIAERADAEAQLRHAQKMEAIGKLTGGVAHDFNNVLQIIGGNLQLLGKDVADNPRAARRVETAIAAIARGSKLASQLLALGRRQPLMPKVVNLRRLIHGIDDMLRRALGEAIEIETIVAGGLWNTFVDAAQLENALVNLAINARDAMDGRGKLTIEAGNAYLDAAYAARHAEVAVGQYVMVAVTDIGCGIAPELIERVFEPFFTTKPVGQGTGLGLSMVYGFVKQSDGHIKIYSELGHGTTIRLYLPRARGREDIETEIETDPSSGGTETILVVEDDDDLRSTVVEMLSDLGYRVLKARDAESALAIVEGGARIDLLFTDVVMPGRLRGPELARRARERLPGIAVLFTSGYTENAIVHGGRLDEGVDLLSKPYGRDDLARRLRHALRNQAMRDPSRRQPAHGDGAAPPPGLRVLLVEDDAVIRRATTGMLVALGHAVLEAADFAGALGLFDRHAPDVLVTDIRLPGIAGTELAREALRRQPGIRVVFATGDESALPDPNSADPLARAIRLRKPYDEQALADALDSAVAGKAP